MEHLPFPLPFLNPSCEAVANSDLLVRALWGPGRALQVLIAPPEKGQTKPNTMALPSFSSPVAE